MMVATLRPAAVEISFSLVCVVKEAGEGFEKHTAGQCMQWTWVRGS